MATKKHILILNNLIMTDPTGSPLFEVKEGNKVVYMNYQKEIVPKEYVMKFITDVERREMEDPAYPLCEDANTYTTRFDDFGMCIRYTPLYNLRRQMATATTLKRIAGSSLDIEKYWADLEYHYYIEELYKYAQLLAYIETAARKFMHAGSPFLLKNNGVRMMSIVNIDVPALYNPMKNLKGLFTTKLFKAALTGDDSKLELDPSQPTVFRTDIVRGKVPIWLATPSDFMKLLNINFADSVSSKHLYMLASAVFLKTSYSTNSLENAPAQYLEFPTGRNFYNVVNADGASVMIFFDMNQANAYVEDNPGTMVQLADTASLFIASAFPKSQTMTNNKRQELVNMIREAEYVF